MNTEEVEQIISLVPWGTIAAKVGYCDEVPLALLDLASPKEGIRGRSAWKIDNKVVVQGGLFEGALFVTPFLVEMLRRGADGWAEIYDLLFEIANGASDLAPEVGYSVRYEPFLHYLPKSSGRG